MTGALPAEWLKVRTARLPWGLLAVGVALSGLHAVLFDSNAGGSGHATIDSLTTRAGQTQAVAIPMEMLLVATAIGVVIATGEFRHGTATGTYLAVPDRVRVLVAKMSVAAGIGAIAGLVGALVTAGIGLGFTIGQGNDVLLGAATIARFVVGATIGAAVLAAAGAAVGSLIRSQVGALLFVFLWGFVIEPTIGGIYETALRYLPYKTAASLAGVQLDGGVEALPLAAAVVGVASVALLAMLAATTSLQRDVT